jgi:hypothetical protein
MIFSLWRIDNNSVAVSETESVKPEFARITMSAGGTWTVSLMEAGKQRTFSTRGEALDYVLGLLETRQAED